MPDDNRFRNEEDREFHQWMENRQPQEDNSPASVAFTEMMRQAAARREPPTTAAAPSGDTPVFDDASPEPPKARPPQQQRRPRRKERRAQRTVGIVGGIIRSFIVVFAAAGLTATIFTWWTPSRFISSDVRQELSVALATSVATAAPPTSLPTPNWARRVGVVSGHRGPQNDPGAVCPDGLTEASINENVATMVVRNLRGFGYTVDLLDEFDPRLDGYQAAALLSIHANSCQDYGEYVSGYLISAAAARITSRGTDQLLVDCVAQSYGLATGLERREGATVDMTDYHTFREIHPQTPAAIIELGFMLADRQILTDRTDLLATSITERLRCFLEPGTFQGT